MRAALGLVTLLGLSVMGGGCATMAVGAAAGVGVFAVQERTIGEGIDDASGSAELKARLLRMDGAAFRRVDVEVASGRALLTGAVPSEDHRQAAERVAWSIRQIHDVANEIQVGPSVGMLRSVSDEALTAHVRARLMADRDVRSLDVNVETNAGVVYLMGLVRTDAEIHRAADVASRVRGVRQVVSYMAVRPAGRVVGKPVDNAVAEVQ